jgi:peptidoglycan/xylan/chitin deacetylase (PgdA/CDA1 family)
MLLWTYVSAVIAGLAPLIWISTTPYLVPTILIHDVADRHPQWDHWTISKARFDEIERLIRTLGVRTLSLSEVDRLLAGQLAPMDTYRTLYLSIDDGERSALDVVARSLSASRLKATFFVVAGWGRPRYLSHDEVRDLVQNHRQEVGSHTMTHASLPKVGQESALQTELRQSRDLLSKWTQADVRALAYPKGEFDGRVQDRARQAGYRLAFTTDSGYLEPGLNPLELPRFQLNSDTPVSVIEDYLLAPERDRRLRLLAAGLMVILGMYGGAYQWRRVREHAEQAEPVQ